MSEGFESCTKVPDFHIFKCTIKWCMMVSAVDGVGNVLRGVTHVTTQITTSPVSHFFIFCVERLAGVFRFSHPTQPLLLVLDLSLTRQCRNLKGLGWKETTTRDTMYIGVLIDHIIRTYSVSNLVPLVLELRSLPFDLRLKGNPSSRFQHFERWLPNFSHPRAS